MLLNNLPCWKYLFWPFTYNSHRSFKLQLTYWQNFMRSFHWLPFEAFCCRGFVLSNATRHLPRLCNTLSMKRLRCYNPAFSLQFCHIICRSMLTLDTTVSFHSSSARLRFTARDYHCKTHRGQNLKSMNHDSTNLQTQSRYEFSIKTKLKFIVIECYIVMWNGLGSAIIATSLNTPRSRGIFTCLALTGTPVHVEQARSLLDDFANGG